MAKSRLEKVLGVLEKTRPNYIVTLDMPYHPRLAYLLNDSRKNGKTQLNSLIEFFSALPRGYGGTSAIKMEVKEGTE